MAYRCLDYSNCLYRLGTTSTWRSLSRVGSFAVPVRACRLRSSAIEFLKPSGAVGLVESVGGVISARPFSLPRRPSISMGRRGPAASCASCCLSPGSEGRGVGFTAHRVGHDRCGSFETLDGPGYDPASYSARFTVGMGLAEICGLRRGSVPDGSSVIGGGGGLADTTRSALRIKQDADHCCDRARVWNLRSAPSLWPGATLSSPQARMGSQGYSGRSVSVALRCRTCLYFPSRWLKPRLPRSPTGCR